jgi:hypothetical protein
MPKLLPTTDFRARRVILVDSDFAHVTKTADRPTDLIDRQTWESIVVLPDDVAVRTSTYHGITLAQLHDLWTAWIESVGDVQDCLFDVMLDAGDDFQAATYNALTGFYRFSMSGLRSALELVTIGVWAQVSGKNQEFQKWRGGKEPISFGKACDGLITAADALQRHVKNTVKDTLFDQKSPTSEGGFVRRIYSGVSEFSHSRPGYADGDMRRSNGPIYIRSVFKHVAWTQFETLGLCFVLVLLARPKLRLPKSAVDLLNDPARVKSRVTRSAFCYLSSRAA